MHSLRCKFVWAYERLVIINLGCKITFEVPVLIVTRKFCDFLVNQNSVALVVKIHFEKYLYPLLLFIHFL